MNPQPSTPSPPAPLVPPSSDLVVPWSAALRRFGLPLALFAALWVDLVRQLSYTWETNEQYAYGWFVPFLALGLLLGKWASRPASQPQELSFWPALLLILFALCFLPLRVVHEVNPDWPLISWAITSGLVAVSLFAVYLAGGPGWVRHFTFPICFVLVSVQWPYRIEHSLTQNLMQVVASLTVEIVGWFGVPAIQQGNLIELSMGVLGVDEACSGIRSFQSTLMAALFLGELNRLRVPFRLLLVGAGLAVAFLLNVCRTLILTWQANAHGLSATDKWHDPAGLIIAVACFAVLWLLAVMIKRKWSPSSPVVGSPAVFALPRYFVWGLACWVAFVLIGNEAWFRVHESKRQSTVDWTMAFPTNVATFQEIAIPTGVMHSLKADSGESGGWQTRDGGRWQAYYFRWRSGSMLSLVQARCHRPEVCLPASGRSLERDAGTKVFNVHSTDISFRSYVFNQRGEPLFVFFCLWEDGGENLPRTEKLTLTDRLLASLTAKRRLGQRTLEFIVSGYATLEEAEAGMRAQLPELLSFTKSSPAD